MASLVRNIGISTLLTALVGGGAYLAFREPSHTMPPITVGDVAVHGSVAHDISPSLTALAIGYVNFPERDNGVAGMRMPANAVAPPDAEAEREAEEIQGQGGGPIKIVSPHGADFVEQTKEGTKPAARLVASVEGAGPSFVGPQGSRGSSLDYALAVGPNHIFAIANGGGIHIWTKRGLPDPKTKKPLFDSTGVPLYGPVNVKQIWRGFGGQCDTRGSGDAVVRYDQLADRWLVVVPLFSLYDHKDGQQPFPQEGVPTENWKGQPGQPGAAVKLDPPPPPDPNAPPPAGRRGAGAGAGAGAGGRAGAGAGGRAGAGADSGAAAAAAAAAAARRGAGGGRAQYPPNGAPLPGDTTKGTYGMCYAVSTTSDPLGTYYRYEFIRPYFPDYPRPAIWPDGYYIPTSTSDNFIQKHACAADRAKMLKGEDATEQCIIINGIPFLQMADMDGKTIPPPGAPVPTFAAGGSQLRQVYEDSVIYSWKFHVDWKDPKNTKLIGPVLIPVAPYHFLCDGQLKQCVPQPGSNTRLDSQGDKLMARLTYRRIGNVEHVVAAHSINSSLNGGGLRWYEFRIDPKNRDVSLYQQGTYTPGAAKDSLYRWVPSAVMDKFGNIGIGYSYGGSPNFAGIRFTGRQPTDPKGMLTFKETIAMNGTGPVSGNRFEDYTQTAVDPDDDCTIWHVGAYGKAGVPQESSRISAFKMPGCK